MSGTAVSTFCDLVTNYVVCVCALYRCIMPFRISALCANARQMLLAAATLCGRLYCSANWKLLTAAERLQHKLELCCAPFTVQ
jgi:hypothetical protein